MSAVILLKLACEGTEGCIWFVLTFPHVASGLNILGPFNIDKAAEQTRALSLGSGYRGNMFTGDYSWPFVSDTCEKMQDTEQDGTAIWQVRLVPAGECYLVGSIARPCEGELCFSYSQARASQVALCTPSDPPDDG